MSVVLRVYGLPFDPEAFAASVGRSAIERVWRAGDMTRTGGRSTTSGAVVLLSESEEMEQMTVEAENALTRLLPIVAESLAQGASAEVDFAIFVSDGGPTSLSLGAEIVRKIARCNIRIVVTGYPIASDAEDGD